jgi:hypothetical protein
MAGCNSGHYQSSLSIFSRTHLLLLSSGYIHNLHYESKNLSEQSKVSVRFLLGTAQHTDCLRAKDNIGLLFCPVGFLQLRWSTVFGGNSNKIVG